MIDTYGFRILILCIATGLAACKARHANAPVATDSVPKPSAEAPPQTPVPAEVISLLRADKYMAELLEPAPDGSVANLTARNLDLNADGHQEVVVEGRGPLCGASNCSMWVFASKEDGYRLLLSADSVQELEAGKTSTNGYLDVVTSAHASAFEHNETTYQFDGRTYQPVKCATVSFMVEDEKGEFHESKEPKATAVDCEQH